MKQYIPFYPYLAGLSTYVPGLHNFAPLSAAESSIYATSVFVRHISNYLQHQEEKVLPNVILELGPGNSVGFGLAAMLLYECDYMSLDVGEFFDPTINLVALDEIYEQLSAGTFDSSDISIDFMPKNRNTIQVHDIQTLSPSETTITDRYNLLRSRIQEPLPCPLKERWTTPILQKETNSIFLSSRRFPNPTRVEAVFSQAVLEHIDDLPGLFIHLVSTGAPNAVHSHHVDLSCHNLTREWNGHWAFSDAQWRIIRGRRPQFINRAPESYLLTLFKNLNLPIIHQERYRNTDRPSIRKNQSRINSSPSDFSAESCYFLLNSAR